MAVRKTFIFEVLKGELLLSFDSVELLPDLYNALPASGSKIEHFQLGQEDGILHWDIGRLSQVLLRRNNQCSMSPQYSLEGHA